MTKLAIILVSAALAIAGFCFINKEPVKIGMTITSPVFKNNENIPAKFACDGANVSPRLLIADVPASAKSLALIMDDPDAPMDPPDGGWVHWVTWNIDPATKEIPEGGKIGMEGTTSFGRTGYGGPCPPSGVHRYFFKLYALDTALDLPDSAKKEDLERAMEKHILTTSQIIGLYSRK